MTTYDGITKDEAPISLEQWAAENAGFTVTVRSGEEWEHMSAAEFAQYQVLIVGDPSCSDTAVSAVNSAATWTSVVMGKGPNSGTGNRTVVGTDPEYHYSAGGGGAQPKVPGEPGTAGAEHLEQDGISFAGSVPGATGVYFDTSCTDLEEPSSSTTEEEEESELLAKPAVAKPASVPQEEIEGPDGRDITEVLDKLTTEGPGHWNEDVSPPCGGNVAQIAESASFDSGPTTLTDEDIEGWGCSVHISFPGFPTDWNPLAVATEAATHPTCGTDPDTGEGACGEAYVLVAGTGVTAKSPDISLEPVTHSDAAGGEHSVTATVIEEKAAPEPTVRPDAVAGTHITGPAVGVAVRFAVNGQNNGVSGTCTLPGGGADPECKTDENGKVIFTYKDVNGAGTDSINASVVLGESVQSATAEETWTGSTSSSSSSSSSSTSSSSKPAPAPAPVISVLATKAVIPPAQGTAHIASSVRGCVADSGYLASVHGTSVASVTFTLDGHTIKTLHKSTSHDTYALRLGVPSGAGHHLTIHVVFTAASKTHAATLHQTLARCAARKVSLPRFTG